jgi:4-amino-4-deoxy-L-arabinose transferase-like glycosyltransferase
MRGRLATLGLEPLLVGVLVALGLVAQGLNTFHYPAPGRFDDEGIYVAQAWAILRQGRLSPYTYFYDHAPAGWILLAGWMGLTGGPRAFGSAIDSGRLLMLLLHLAMVALLYRTARGLGCGVPAAALAAALFSLSPLAILYQRPVLLDTFMLFWILLGLDLLLDARGRLSRLVLSGVSFGLAMLSKETALFLLPALPGSNIALLMVGSIPGILLGSRLTLAVPERALRGSLATVLALSSLKMFGAF